MLRLHRHTAATSAVGFHVALKSTLTSKQKGNSLEDRVARLLADAGHGNIRRNVLVKDSNGNKSEIDITYGRFIIRYVECKAYSESNTVPLDDVAKFKSVLQLLGVSPRRGLFVTTSTYTPRATTIGIRTIDGEGLQRWERRVRIQKRVRQLLHSVIALSFAAGGVVFVALVLAPSAIEAVPELDQSPPWPWLALQRYEAARGWRQGRSGPSSWWQPTPQPPTSYAGHAGLIAGKTASAVEDGLLDGWQLVRGEAGRLNRKVFGDAAGSDPWPSLPVPSNEPRSLWPGAAAEGRNTASGGSSSNGSGSGLSWPPSWWPWPPSTPPR